MTPPNSVIFVKGLFLCFLCSSVERYAFAEKPSNSIEVSSLIAKPGCSSHRKGVNNTAATLQVVDKHSPCFQTKDNSKLPPTLTQILEQHLARVTSINSRFSKQSAAVTLPARDGRIIGPANYVVTMGFGTPSQQLSLIFDTGSDQAWTQCERCVIHCYKQKETIFDPSKSRSYSNVTCSSQWCDKLKSEGRKLACDRNSTCIYDISYNDNSNSTGFLASENLTLSQGHIINNFIFGCGQDNEGTFEGFAGLLGLGRGQFSIVNQTANTYDGIFSYCLPSSPNSTGYLTFGSTAYSKNIKFTPLSPHPLYSPSLYGISITGISINGTHFPINSSPVSSGGAIIDSGTIFTQLPPAAYDAVQPAFKRFMAHYPPAKRASPLNTCYDLSKYKTVQVPKIVFHFEGDVEMELNAKGILYGNKLAQMCFAFLRNSHVKDVTIFGNAQQRTWGVVYDVQGMKLGLDPMRCT